jgi:ureidoacrylate peracid hydrolase
MHRTDIPRTVLDTVLNRRGRRFAYDAIDPAKTALVVVDMQKYFMAEPWMGACPIAQEIVPNVNRLAARLRDRGGCVVWIQTEATAESRESWANLRALYSDVAATRRWKELARESDGFALWEGLDVESGDERVIKTRYSAFVPGSSDLDRVLRARGIDTIVITGVATNVCCESTGRDGMMMGYRTILVADGNATATDEEHLATLRTFLSYFGDVQSADEVLAHLDRGDASAAAE